MTKIQNVNLAIGAFLILASIAIFAPDLLNFQQNVVVLGEFDVNFCAIDAAKTFSPTLEKVLVSVQDFGTDQSRNAKVSLFENKEYTPITLTREIKSYISNYCEPATSDYCMGQRPRAQNTKLAVALSGNLLANEEGVYWGGFKVFKADQRFSTIVADQHPEITSEDTYNAKYFGNLYGKESLLQNGLNILTCTPNYGLPEVTTQTTQRVVVSGTTTTAPAGTSGFDFSNPIIPTLAVLGLFGTVLLTRKK